MSQLSGRERVRRALRGEPTDHPAVGPLAVHFCARDAGVSLERYTTDARALTDCVVRYAETYRPDAVWLSSDTWVTAEAMGAPVAFASTGQPLGGVGEPLIRSARDIDRIAPPDPSTQGRMPLMLDALRRINELIGDEMFVVACFDQLPFSLACALMGIEELMLNLSDDRPLVEALLDRCVEYSAAYGEALSRAGADMLSAGDSPAGLVGPREYRDLALPVEREVFHRLRSATDVPLSLHICGDSRRILRDMATSGADVIEFDHQVSVSEACEAVGPDIALWGNLDPVSVLARGDEDRVRRACETLIDAMAESEHRRFVVSSGCTLAVETPPANVRAMLRAARVSSGAYRENDPED